MDSMKILCEVPFKDKSATELDLSGKDLGTEGALVVAEYLDDNGALSSLNMASNCLCGLAGDGRGTFDAAGTLTSIITLISHVLARTGITALANAIPDMRALSSANLLGNFIPVEQAQLVKIMRSKENLTTLCGLSREETELNFSRQDLGAGDAVLIANDISDMRAVSSLVLKNNKLLTAEAGKVLSDMLTTNTVLKVLDLSSNNWKEYVTCGDLMGDGPGFAKELAVGISDNRALLSANLLGNYIPVEQAQELVKIMRAKESFTTLCGLSREETELDFSRQKLGAGDAVLIANDISDMGALTRLNLANNNLGEIVLAAGWRSKENDGRYPWVGPDGQEQNKKPAGKSEGIIAIADAIPNMRALSFLNLSENNMNGAEAGKALGNALAANTVLKELDLSGGKDGHVVRNMDIAFVKAFTPGLSDNRALTKFDISNNDLKAEGGVALAAGLKGNHIITELNISSDALGLNSDYSADTSGIIAIADAIPDMGALTSLNLSSNNLKAEGAKIMAEALEVTN
jgi:hypothetical protein